MSFYWRERIRMKKNDIEKIQSLARSLNMDEGHESWNKKIKEIRERIDEETMMQIIKGLRKTSMEG